MKELGFSDQVFTPLAFLPASHSPLFSFNYEASGEEDVKITNGLMASHQFDPQPYTKLIPATSHLKGSLFNSPQGEDHRGGLIGLGFNLFNKDNALNISADFALRKILTDLENHGMPEVAREIAQNQCQIWQELDLPKVCSLAIVADKYCDIDLREEREDETYLCNGVKAQPTPLDEYLVNLENNRLYGSVPGGCSIHSSDGASINNITFFLLLVFPVVVFLRRIKKRLWVLLFLLSSCGAPNNPSHDSVNTLPVSPLQATAEPINTSYQITRTTTEVLDGTWINSCMPLVGEEDEETLYYLRIHFHFQAHRENSGSYELELIKYEDKECHNQVKTENSKGSYQLNQVQDQLYHLKIYEIETPHPLKSSSSPMKVRTFAFKGGQDVQLTLFDQESSLEIPLSRDRSVHY